MNSGFILCNRVRELRTRLKLRQSDLAREVDVTRQTILAIEKGRLNPSILVSLKIARVLREPVGYIFFLDHTGIASQGGDKAGPRLSVGTEALSETSGAREYSSAVL